MCLVVLDGLDLNHDYRMVQVDGNIVIFDTIAIYAIIIAKVLHSLMKLKHYCR